MHPRSTSPGFHSRRGSAGAEKPKAKNDDATKKWELRFEVAVGVKNQIIRPAQFETN
jgi:hypothetical protein